MKIRMLTLSAGPNGVRMAGQVIDVDQKEAKALIEGGYAEAIDEPKQEDEEKPKGGKGR